MNQIPVDFLEYLGQIKALKQLEHARSEAGSIAYKLLEIANGCEPMRAGEIRGCVRRLNKVFVETPEIKAWGLATAKRRLENDD